MIAVVTQTAFLFALGFCKSFMNIVVATQSEKDDEVSRKWFVWISQVHQSKHENSAAAESPRGPLLSSPQRTIFVYKVDYMLEGI